MQPVAVGVLADPAQDRPERMLGLGVGRLRFARRGVEPDGRLRDEVGDVAHAAIPLARAIPRLAFRA
jgi:hypothetical protein